MSSANAGLGWAPETPGRLGRWVEQLRGRPLTYALDSYVRELSELAALEAEVSAASDDALRARARDTGAALPESLAVLREIAERAVGLRPFDVQMIGAMAMHRGHLIEMQTGEGKTLVAALTAALSARAGGGLYVLTFNDYLARRDAAWMGPIYEWLGLRVGVVQDGDGMAERRAAYRADVTYLTAKQAGFDYLRDGLCYDAGARVHQPLRMAIVDEADSILIDEARVPLVIASRSEEDFGGKPVFADLARALERGRHFASDVHGRNVYLTDDGLRRAEQLVGGINLHEPDHAATFTRINLALHAEVLLRRDVDYIVRDGRVELVDELTGRVVRDRHWPDGLHAAVEAKEGVQTEHQGDILGSISLQHFFRLYPRLAGMTATARPEEEELAETYGLEVVVIPPNRPCVRVDAVDRVFSHREAKFTAVVREVCAAHALGRPVLVGTASVAESQELEGRLAAHEVVCQVLNAKADDREAQIIAQAGVVGAVTISTNMAGRGTDIKLGGEDERERARVVALGGLYVIGTNCHESRRIDMQLRGRAGRQGDPGESRLFISLEDDLIRRYLVTAVLPEAARVQRDAPIDDAMVPHRIAWARRVVEGRNFELRRTLWRYSSFIDSQRGLLRERRDTVLDDPALGYLARAVNLYGIDRAWAAHLGAVADIREAIQMVSLAGQNPLEQFLRRTDRAFAETLRALDAEIEATLAELRAGEAEAELGRRGIEAPSATWTYLVDEDPFERAGILLMSGNDIGLGVGAALWGPVFAIAALYIRYFKRRRE
jgi:preprotein translocase subunit SecA